ncbi:DJ-1/PfpI family protein [Marinobacter sp. SS21]|uniref:DJ-1/PfpI family protein n=1 Tax=Marinobacter sp. SS21 TaxID=2979460 RepID=UPI00232BEEA9|nr:DJ-1/PfpI family protein [Marinobacter sp. SS21]MDC0661399.1 DJ-1/PfpI family protein [Marinobacter sp. SS21]
MELKEMFSRQTITLLLALVIFTGWNSSANAADKKIGVLVYDEVLTSDVIAPAEVFGVASRKAWFSDYDVVLINVERTATVTTEEGVTLAVDANIYDDLDLDVLIVNSAYEMDWLFENEDLTRFMQDQATRVEWLASNCSGAFLYAHAGLLDGYRATTWAGGESGLQREFPNIDVVFDRNVVVDRNRITSNGGVPSYQGALVLLALMSGESNAKEVFETIQLNRLIPWSEITKYGLED